MILKIKTEHGGYTDKAMRVSVNRTGAVDRCGNSQEKIVSRCEPNNYPHKQMRSFNGKNTNRKQR